MEHNEQFILVIISDDRGQTFNFKKNVRDGWIRSISEYRQEGYDMVANWLKIGYEIKAVILVDRNPLFHISKIL